MRVHTYARSVSRFVIDRVLREPCPSARVLAVFQNACDLVTRDKEVIAVVGPGIGNGPLNVVVDRDYTPFQALEPGAPARMDRRHVQLGGLEIALNVATVWEPRPNWPVLRAYRSGAASRLSSLSRLCWERGPDNSLFTLMEQAPRAASAHSPMGVSARRAADALRQGWMGNRASLREGARLLAGRGGGLTPSGDDFLSGLMLWAWLAHPDPDGFCRAVVDTAAELTTTLSAAFLRAAARGECGAPWHALLAGLAEEDDVALAAAAERVLSYGATSGADALTGFLWMKPTL